MLPEVTHRVWAAIDRPDGDARTLAGLIRTDAAFAGHLLRIANSPAYASRAPITSLQQAVSRLGFRTLGEIAVIIACKTRAFQVKGHEAEVRDLFRHSLATALLAREVARMRRLDVENAFVAGLLHDVGRPTLIQALVDEHARCDGERAAPLSADNFETVVTVLHEEIGAEMRRRLGPAAEARDERPPPPRPRRGRRRARGRGAPLLRRRARAPRDGRP